MAIQLEEINLSKFILVGDRILIKPRSKQDRTKTGLLLPPTVQENEKVQSGYVVKVGPGMPVPMVNDEDEPWKGSQDKVKAATTTIQRSVIGLLIIASSWAIWNFVLQNLILK